MKLNNNMYGQKRILLHIMFSCKLVYSGVPCVPVVLQIVPSYPLLFLQPRPSCKSTSPCSGVTCEYPLLVPRCLLRSPKFISLLFAAWSFDEINDTYMPDGLVLSSDPTLGWHRFNWPDASISEQPILTEEYSSRLNLV